MAEQMAAWAHVAREALTDRDKLGRAVREAWIRWAEAQPEPKPSWLVPYDELAEPDKEADRQIGEALTRTFIAEADRLNRDGPKAKPFYIDGLIERAADLERLGHAGHARAMRDAADDLVRLLAVATPVNKAAADVLAERQRQIYGEHWTAEHDDANAGNMAKAAACYAWAGSSDRTTFRDRIERALWDHFGSDDGNPIRRMWPWGRHWWKPKNPRRDLVRAAALILAEIERIDRAAVPAPEGGAT